jgi:hypothetical protein
MAIVACRSQKCALHAIRSRILMKFAARRRDAVGVGELRFPDSTDVCKRRRAGSGWEKSTPFSASCPKRHAGHTRRNGPRPCARHRISAGGERGPDRGIISIETNRDGRIANVHTTCGCLLGAVNNDRAKSSAISSNLQRERQLAAWRDQNGSPVPSIDGGVACSEGWQAASANPRTATMAFRIMLAFSIDTRFENVVEARRS